MAGPPADGAPPVADSPAGDGSALPPPPPPVAHIRACLPNPLSFLLFSWFTPVLSTGWRRPLQQADLPFLTPSLTTASSADAFAAAFAARAPSAVAMRAAAAAAAAAGSAEVWPGGAAGKRGKKKAKAKAKADASAAAAAAPSDPASRAASKEAAAAAALVAGKSGRPLLGALWQLNGSRLLGSLALQLLQSGIQFAGPLLLKVIVTYLQTPASATAPAAVGRAYGAAGAMFASPLLGALAFNHASRLAATAQVRVRAQLTAGVYRKALRLSPRSRTRVEVGRVVNLMSSDVGTLAQFCFPFFNQLVSAPIMLLVALALLWAQIRWGTFIGLAILLASSPASGRFVRKITQLRRAMLTHTDARVRLTNQLLSGIRVLKLYAWEAAQEGAVLEARSAELGRLRAAVPYRVGMQTLLFASPVLAAVASFAAYGSAAPREFTAPRVFAAIALFSLMRFPLILLPFTLVEAGNAAVSARRLSQFLSMEEREGGDGRGLDPPDWEGGLGVQIKGGQFYWPEGGAPVGGGVAPGGPPGGGGASGPGDRRKGGGTGAKKGSKTATSTDDGGGSVAIDLSKAGPPGPHAPGGDDNAIIAPPPDSPRKAHAPGSLAATRASAASTRGGAGEPPGFDPLTAGGPAAYWLRDIDLELKPGELVCVVGRVGSGKSSLLAAALGEMSRAVDDESSTPTPTTHRLGGRVAFVAQQAWIANSTLKENILFGRAFDPDRWEATLDACCLRPDLASLAAGAETEIGEKGINLSGGQKQRVAVARAMYAGADVYVLDDPLSAVDVHVGATMFGDAIAGAMKSGEGGGHGGGAVLLATNQLQYLSRPETSRVVYLENGRIGAQGTFEAVRAASPGLRALLEDFESRAAAQAAQASAARNGSGEGGRASRTPSLDLSGTDLAALRAASRGASLDLSAVRRASLEAPRGGTGPPPPLPPSPRPRPPGAHASRVSRPSPSSGRRGWRGWPTRRRAGGARSAPGRPACPAWRAPSPGRAWWSARMARLEGVGIGRRARTRPRPRPAPFRPASARSSPAPRPGRRPPPRHPAPPRPPTTPLRMKGLRRPRAAAATRLREMATAPQKTKTRPSLWRRTGRRARSARPCTPSTPPATAGPASPPWPRCGRASSPPASSPTGGWPGGRPPRRAPCARARPPPALPTWVATWACPWRSWSSPASGRR